MAPFRYKRLGYLALGVTDLDRSTTFAREVFGLDVVKTDDEGRRFLRGHEHHHDLVFEERDEALLLRSAWELESEADLEQAFEYFRKEGLTPEWVDPAECSALALERAFRVLDPLMRIMWEYFVDMTVIPSPLTNQLTSFQGGKHFGLSPADGTAVNDYLCDRMGFLMSDFFEGRKITLLRAFPNPNHHSIALIGSGRGVTRMHHVAFMVDTIDDIGKLFNRVKRHNVEIQFGIGRHPTSGSIHLYIYDHDNFVWEYTLGMEQFPEHGARAARRMSSDPEEFDLWGAEPDTTRRSLLPRVVTYPGKNENARSERSAA